MTNERCSEWRAAIENLCKIMDDFASPATARRFSSDVVDQNFNTLELLREFTEFYGLVGPQNETRYRKLPPHLDAMLAHFASTVSSVVGEKWESTPDSVIVASDGWQALQSEAHLIVEALKPISARGLP